MEEEQYWYAFSFRDNGSIYGCYSGYSNKNINMNKIKKAKEVSGGGQNCALVSCAYLGYMTKTEFSEGDA